jgi:hypothetical protein
LYRKYGTERGVFDFVKAHLIRRFHLQELTMKPTNEKKAKKVWQNREKVVSLQPIYAGKAQTSRHREVPRLPVEP